MKRKSRSAEYVGQPTHFAMVPKLAQRELKPFELALYTNYKQTCAEDGACTKTNATLAAETQMSVGTVKQARKALEQKGFIAVEHHVEANGKEYRAPTVTICDVWEANHMRFSGGSPRDRGGHHLSTPGHDMSTPRSPRDGEGVTTWPQRITIEEKPIEEKPDKEKTFVPSGTAGPDIHSQPQATPVGDATTRNEHDTLLEIVKAALSLGDASYPLVARYAQFLSGKVPERDGKKRSNGDWFTYQPSLGMSPREIRAFGLWLSDCYDGSPLRKPAAVVDYIGQFRADGLHELYLRRAEPSALSPPSPPDTESADASGDNLQDFSSEIEQIMATLSESKRA